MPSEKDNTWKCNRYIKWDNMPYIIYAELEFLTKKIDGCAKNQEKSTTTKLGEHIPCGYSISAVLAFDHIENNHNLYLGEDIMKTFCGSLRKHAASILNL